MTRSNIQKLKLSRTTLATGLLLCGVITTSFAIAADDQPDPRDELLQLMQGTFHSPGGGPGGADESMTDRRIRINAPEIGSHLVYMQIDVGSEDAQRVYRQRLLVFELDGETGQVLQRTHAFSQPEQYVAATAESEVFAGLSEADIEASMDAGCEQIWSMEAGEWQGYVSPESCRIWSERRGDWRLIESASKLSADYLMIAERGFDDAGEQVFGTPPGQWTQLSRQPGERD